MTKCYEEHKKGKVVLASRDTQGDYLYIIYPNGKVETEHQTGQIWFESSWSSRGPLQYAELLTEMSNETSGFEFIASWYP